LTVTCGLLQPRENTTEILSRTRTLGRQHGQGLNQQTMTVMRLLHTINASLHSKLEALAERGLEGFVVQEENKKLRKEIGQCRQLEASMKGLVDEANMKGLVDQANMKGLIDGANFNARLAAQQRNDRNEQYSRLWNLKLLFIPEKPGPAPETPEESEKEALKSLFRELLGLKQSDTTAPGLSSPNGREKAERSQADHRPFRLEEDQTRGVAETPHAEGFQPQGRHCRKSDGEQLAAFPSSIRTPWNPGSME